MSLVIVEELIICSVLIESRPFLVFLFAGAELFVLGAGEELLGGKIKLAEYLTGRLSRRAAFLSGYAVIIGGDKQ